MYKKSKINNIETDKSIINLSAQENSNNKKQLPTITHAITSPL